jgi:hypothetical protein
MNESQTITAAIERRFSRAAIPDVPRGPWSAPTAPSVRPYAAPRFVYAAAVLGMLVTAGMAAQASGALPAAYARLVMSWSGSSKPLPPLVHPADRLTMAQTQQQMPFTIVVPAGLPAQTTLQYAHVISRQPPRVALNYQAVIGGRYYRIIVNEATAADGPPVAHFSVMFKAKDGRVRNETFTRPLRRWKHGAVVMEMLPDGLPPAVVDRIVRENTRYGR